VEVHPAEILCPLDLFIHADPELDVDLVQKVKNQVPSDDHIVPKEQLTLTCRYHELLVKYAVLASF
jgi:hypothetical protein